MSSGFEAFTLATVVVLAVAISVPLVFFVLVTRRLCCDQQLRHVLAEQIEEFGACEDSSQSLPRPPSVVLSFRMVKYSVPSRDILKGISAYFLPRTVTAVMGPSGCGKSTLLDILADQKSFGTIKGDIRINGELRSPLFRRASAYVQQFDSLYPQLTPRETLFFVTELRLAESLSAKEKYERVVRTLHDLDLVHVADTRIGEGESSGGLSGGQKRRVTVAIELVTDPGLILLDEPTSGLDAYGSLQLIKVLRNLADDGRTIALTIHQPRADIFRMFDNLLLMKLGVTMYFGPVDGVFPYFEGLGLTVDYAVNPADFIVDLTQDKTPEEKAEERAIIARIDAARARADAKAAAEAEAEATSDVNEKSDNLTAQAEDVSLGVHGAEEAGGNDPTDDAAPLSATDAVAASSAAAAPAAPADKVDDLNKDEDNTGDGEESIDDADTIKEDDTDGEESIAAGVKAADAEPSEHAEKEEEEEKEEAGTAGPKATEAANPAAASKETTEAGDGNVAASKSVDLDELCQLYGESELRRKVHRTLYKIHRGSFPSMPPTLKEHFGADSSQIDGIYPTGFFKQVNTLARRSIVNDMRNSAYVIGNWIVGPIMMLFYGALYSNVSQPGLVEQDLDGTLAAQQSCNLNNTYLERYDPGYTTGELAACGTELGLDQQLSFVRSSLVYQFMAAAYFSEGPFVAQVFKEKRMFSREHASRSYSAGAFHFAWYIRMFFAAFCKGLLFPPIGYFAAQLTATAEAYFLFAIFFGGMSACGASMALLASSALPGLELAQSFFVLINIIGQNLSGYWIVELYIGWWFRWAFYINLFRYAFEGAIVAQQLPNMANFVLPGTTFSFRQRAWLFALVVIVFAVCLQLFAFLSTYIIYNTSSTDPREMLEGSEDGLDEESFASSRHIVEERLGSSQVADPESSKGASPGGGVQRTGLLAKYRDANLTSVRNIHQAGNLGAINTTLANNGGMLFG